ncbi:hypothetical protein [Halomonas marinisediminis]|uniref:Uncharacterized protein n=1 Tax=Halomonas marinisediminis TaxID=2546095 RepID=A0ABY2D636_9GAMM|nr:hypothetical protein [Halomonas marinisediminis]TDB01948.1 hypothetical protein E0702_11095 [Halomonas marinisediminis]
MSELPPPNAPSLEALRRDLLRGSRFFGLPQWLWGLLLGSLAYLGFQLVGSALPLPFWALCVLLGWGVVELAFLPRRLEATRLAQYERRQAITRLAMHRGVGLSQVR